MPRGYCSGAITQGTARVVERTGRVTGYATSIAFFGHAVAQINENLPALIAASGSFPGPRFPAWPPSVTY